MAADHLAPACARQFASLISANKEPQRQRPFGDEGDPRNIGDRQCEKEPEARNLRFPGDARSLTLAAK